ncbi:MAG: hypothetical protein RDV48_22485 [Candidatus Eremiobacteraeota bacterium]|nr:hypothetical protein [Candidatus Eremiobacteraeota bacterium]
MSDEEEECGFYVRISGSDRIICDNCGHDNPRGAEVCEECSTPLPGDDDDEEALNTVVGELSGESSGGTSGSSSEGKKGLLYDAKHLRELREACEGIEGGTMSREDYGQVIRSLYVVTQKGAKRFKNDVIKKIHEGMPPEDVQLLNDAQRELERYHEGVSLMLGYLEIGNPTMVRAGFNVAEDALAKLDRIHDRAINISASL